MDPIARVLFTTQRMLDDPNLILPARAELSAAVEALRQQRDTTLAASEARVEKYNRGTPVRADTGRYDSYRPVELFIGNRKIRVGDNVDVDALADRLAACWNYCKHVPTEDLNAGGAEASKIPF